MVRVGNAHHSLVIYISKKLKFYYDEKTYFYVVVWDTCKLPWHNVT